MDNPICECIFIIFFANNKMYSSIPIVWICILYSYFSSLMYIVNRLVMYYPVESVNRADNVSSMNNGFYIIIEFFASAVITAMYLYI